MYVCARHTIRKLAVSLLAADFTDRVRKYINCKFKNTDQNQNA